jgi:hypothetical protein
MAGAYQSDEGAQDPGRTGAPIPLTRVSFPEVVAATPRGHYNEGISE